MYKKVVTILIFFAIILGIVLSMYMINKNNEKPQEITETNKIDISETVTDECTEEYEQEEKIATQTATTEEEKLSPNCIITYKNYYSGCEHTIYRYEEIAEELVNLSQEELQEKFSEWTIEKFSANEVILYKKYSGECGEHYMLRDVDGYIVVYKLTENGDEELLQKTDIPTVYLTKTDMINIENGLIVYGKEDLNKLLEDFE